MQQLPLFDLEDIPDLTAVSQLDLSGSLYAAHFFQRSGPPMWKLGFTTVFPPRRAGQMACIPVAWWPGSMRDERRMHRLWKHDRVSRASEFFYHSDALDRWVLARTREMPTAYRPAQLAAFAEIMLRIRQPVDDYGDAA